MGHDLVKTVYHVFWKCNFTDLYRHLIGNFQYTHILHMRICWANLSISSSTEITQQNARFEVLTMVKIQVEVFCIVTSHSVVGWYKLFLGPFCLPIHPEDVGSNVRQNNGILPQHYMVSQSRRPQLVPNRSYILLRGLLSNFQVCTLTVPHLRSLNNC
jgi:hypothetical protein